MSVYLFWCWWNVSEQSWRYSTRNHIFSTVAPFSKPFLNIFFQIVQLFCDLNWFMFWVIQLIGITDKFHFQTMWQKFSKRSDLLNSHVSTLKTLWSRLFLYLEEVYRIILAFFASWFISCQPLYSIHHLDSYTFSSDRVDIIMI